MIGNLGHNTLVDAVDAAEQVQWGGSMLLLDLCQSSWLLLMTQDVLRSLPVLIFSSMSGLEGAGQMPKANSVSTGSTLGIVAGLLMVDRCCSSCLIH